mmetsp:Transcript_48319/g.146985  ORF Transcript_48319/g.146985 Transcript_48319/m.146985 type:complete len:221 (-) Transcript_48319:1091-1753(-)
MGSVLNVRKTTVFLSTDVMATYHKIAGKHSMQHMWTTVNKLPMGPAVFLSGSASSSAALPDKACVLDLVFFFCIHAPFTLASQILRAGMASAGSVSKIFSGLRSPCAASTRACLISSVNCKWLAVRWDPHDVMCAMYPCNVSPRSSCRFEKDHVRWKRIFSNSSSSQLNLGISAALFLRRLKDMWMARTSKKTLLTNGQTALNTLLSSSASIPSLGFPPK